MNIEEKRQLEDAVIMVLKTIFDPEIPVNVYDLGLIYEIAINDEADVKILMTLTAPNCPVAESMPQDIKDRVGMVMGVRNAEVQLTFEPPWDKDMITDEAKLDLGLL